MSPLELVVALEGIVEDSKETYRLQAFPVWLRHGKKGVSWGQFVQSLGLGYSSPKKEAPTKKRDLSRTYRAAAAVRHKYQGAAD